MTEKECVDLRCPSYGHRGPSTISCIRCVGSPYYVKSIPATAYCRNTDLAVCGMPTSQRGIHLNCVRCKDLIGLKEKKQINCGTCWVSESNWFKNPECLSCDFLKKSMATAVAEARKPCEKAVEEYMKMIGRLAFSYYSSETVTDMLHKAFVDGYERCLEDLSIPVVPEGD